MHTIRLKDDYIKLGQALKAAGVVESGVDAKFAPGFTLDLEPADPTLETEAVEAAKGADVVLMFLGLPEAAESEGFDRETLDMPAKQIALLEAVAAENVFS